MNGTSLQDGYLTAMIFYGLAALLVPGALALVFSWWHFLREPSTSGEALPLASGVQPEEKEKPKQVA